MYPLTVALKSAGAVMPSWGTANAKKALGDPTKPSISSEEVAGLLKTTGTPSFRSLKTMTGWLLASFHTASTWYAILAAPGGISSVAATYVALVLALAVAVPV